MNTCKWNKRNKEEGNPGKWSSLSLETINKIWWWLAAQGTSCAAFSPSHCFFSLVLPFQRLLQDLIHLHGRKLLGEWTKYSKKRIRPTISRACYVSRKVLRSEHKRDLRVAVYMGLRDFVLFAWLIPCYQHCNCYYFF